MFNDDEGIDSYLDAGNGKLFNSIEGLVFPKINTVLKVAHKDIRISIFLEKRLMNAPTFILDGKIVDTVTNFVFLYRFDGLDDPRGAAVIRSFLDEPKSRLFDSHEQTRKSFNQIHHKLNALSNHKLIYHGAINEG